MQASNPTVRPKFGIKSSRGFDTKTVSTACFLLYLYFILDFFLRFSARIPGYGQFRPTLLVFLIICGVLFINRDKIENRFQDPIFKSFFVLIGYLVLSFPLVEWPGSIVRHNLNDFVLAVSFLFFTALIVDTEKRLKWFLVIFVGCQVFRVLEPLYLNITSGYWGSGTHLGPGQTADRLAGAPSDVINPNELGFVIVTAIPFLHYLLWSQGWKSKCLYLALIPALLYALILTMSRGAFIALLVVAFMVFKESRHKFVLIVIAIMVASAGWSVMTPVQKDRYLSLVTDDKQNSATVTGRLEGMVKEFQLGLRRPIVGHGLGTTSEAKFHAFGSTQASHNLYAQLLIELGIVGAIIFLTFLFRIYKGLQKNRQLFNQIDRDSNLFFKNLNTTLLVVFWMYAVYSINYWGVSQYYWYLFAGLCIAFGRLMYCQYVRERDDEGEAMDSVKPRDRFLLARKVSPGRAIHR